MRARQMTYGDWLQIVLLALVWGISFFLTEICLRDFGPLTLATARVGLAAMVLLAFAAMRGEDLPKAWTDWGTLAFMGLINNALPFSLIMWGQVSIDSGLASILNATTPLFTFIFAHFLTKDERMTRRGAAGVGIGFLGAVVLIGPGAMAGIGSQSWGQMAVMAAAMSYAMAGIFGRRLSRFSPIVSAGCMTACAAVMLLPAALLLESPWTARPDLATWAALATLAVISTAFAYILYFRILASAGATNLLLVTFLIPIAAVLLGALALGEVVTLAAVAGMLLIFLGLAVIDGRLFAALRQLRTGGNRQQAEPPNLP